jgi:hypothetical protein
MPRGYARKNQMSVDFKGLDDYIKRLESIDESAVKRAFDSALLASEQVVKESVTAAMQEHNDTGHTASTIISGKAPEWTQSVAKVPVGFEIGTDWEQENDRLASVFLMYGTKVHGQPHITPKREVFDAVYGRAVRNRVRKLQKEAFDKVLRRLK